jgi:uncharacterized protein
VSDTSTILNEIKKAVVSVDPGAEVILFGSRARGDFHEESDWDVLVLTDKEQRDWKFKEVLMDSLYTVELKEGHIITPIIRNRNFWQDLKVTPLYQEIQKDGVIL